MSEESKWYRRNGMGNYVDAKTDLKYESARLRQQLNQTAEAAETLRENLDRISRRRQ